MEINKTFCCGPCRSAPFSLTASIPITGYTPGQNIIIQARAINLTKYNVYEMKFILQQTIVYNSQTPTTKCKIDIKRIQEKRSVGVNARNEERYEISLPIPSIPPTNLGTCRIIQISYDVKVEAKISGLHLNPFVVIPIKIGTIPLQNFQPQPQQNIGWNNSAELPIIQPAFAKISSAPSLDVSTSVPMQQHYVNEIRAELTNWNTIYKDLRMY